MLLNFAQLQFFSDYSASRDVWVVSEVEGERSSLHCGFIEEALHTRNKPERGLLSDVVISLVVQIVVLVGVCRNGHRPCELSKPEAVVSERERDNCIN